MQPDQRGYQATFQVVTDLGVRDDHAIRARIRAAADHLEACEEAVKLAREQRNELVVEAAEALYSTRDVARWARISQPRVLGILAAH